MADLALYSLYAATSEQVLESRKRTHVQWGRGASLSEYLKRDARLDIHEHARDGRLITWVLAPRNDPSSLDFLCACETYRREGFALAPGATIADEVVLFAVASVFTPERHRRKGAARRMMSLLHHVLAPLGSIPAPPASWGGPPPGPFPANHVRGPASVLYSDVGSEFYRLAAPGGSDGSQGWVVDNPRGTVWEVAPCLDEMQNVALDGLTSLSLDAAGELWDCDSLLLRDNLANALPNRATDETLISYAPRGGVAAFQVLRNVFFLESRGEPPLSSWGVQLPTVGSSEDLVYATWSIDVELELRTLIFTRIRCPQSKATEFIRILAAALKVAREYGLSRVEAWNCPEYLLEATGAWPSKTEDRSDHLPAVAWYGDGRVRWLNNEKFAWC
ncbi:hypothetical protein BKA62DRAFT_651637 [Auriculariales sp. MPI-PUGE-AT-0066]|nr:hypothetical protein BKA62DRAFT_651637 [Auriculariales sp. MPI-PUGE-AT-0066]